MQKSFRKSTFKTGNNNNDNAVAEESLPYWKCIINTTDFLERAKSYTHIIKEDGLLVYPQKLQKFEKSIVSVFVVDKCTRKYCNSAKDSVTKSLTSIGVKLHVGCTAAHAWRLQGSNHLRPLTKYLIIRTKYEDRRRTIAIFEVRLLYWGSTCSST